MAILCCRLSDLKTLSERVVQTVPRSAGIRQVYICRACTADEPDDTKFCLRQAGAILPPRCCWWHRLLASMGLLGMDSAKPAELSF